MFIWILLYVIIFSWGFSIIATGIFYLFYVIFGSMEPMDIIDFYFRSTAVGGALGFFFSIYKAWRHLSSRKISD